MLELAWPLVVIQLLQVMYNVADTVWLGRLSADAVGAVSLAFPLVFFFISVAGGFTAAGSILVAQYTGAGSEERAGRIAGQTLSFVGGLSVVLGLAGFLLTGPILSLLPADPATSDAVIPLAAEYMRLFFLGMPFLFGFFVFSSLLRGYGNTRAPMRVMAASVAINVVLDPILIFGWFGAPALGIEGAAVATVISRAVATAIGFYILFATGAGPRIRREHLIPDLGLIRRIVRVGAPVAAEQSMSSLALVGLAGIVATFPPAVVAAYGLGSRLVSLVFLPAMGLGQATNTMVGQNLGAGNPERAARSVHIAAAITTVILFVVTVVSYAFPEVIVGAFLGTGTERAAETIEYGAEFLRIASLMFVFMGVLQVILGAFRGAGNTATAMVLSMVTLWLGAFATVALLVLVFDMGPRGIWIGYATGDVLGALAAAVWFARGTWKRAIVTDEPESAPAASVNEQ